MKVETIKRIATWGKFVGIITMIFGILSAIMGIFAFVIGAIPGLFMAWIGYLMYKTGQESAKFLESPSEEYAEGILDIYGKLLKYYGIYFIVCLVAGFVIGALAVAGGFLIGLA